MVDGSTRMGAVRLVLIPLALPGIVATGIYILIVAWNEFLFALMFTTNARVYYHNVFFRTKMLLLLLAGINMLVFELTAGRSIDRWHKAPSAPWAGKAAAGVSLALWIAIILMGRIIGFTTSRQTVVERPPPGINFDDILQGTPAIGAGTQTPAPARKQ